MNGGRPCIVHLAVDYNTPQRPKTTSAIEWLLDGLDDDYTNVVIAYRRQPRPAHGMESECVPAPRRTFDFPYFGLPLGLGLKSAMRKAAMRTIALLERENIRPDVVHAHKLTFEGIAGWYVARHFNVPLFVSIRGEVETKVFRRKPELRPFFRRLCTDTARLYFVSAWFRDEFRRAIPGTQDKERMLPNIVRNIAPTIVPQPAGDRFVSVFNLDTWKRKGVVWLLDGLAIALKTRPDLRLDIFGRGSDAAQASVRALIAERKLQDHVTLCGERPNDALIASLPGYRGLLLPSLNETFGMVYVEALFAGIPVLFTRDTAIDGYLDGLDVACAAAPRDAQDVAAKIIDMDRRTDELRQNIAAAAPALFARFDPATMLAGYRKDVAQVLGKVD